MPWHQWGRESVTTAGTEFGVGEWGGQRGPEERETRAYFSKRADGMASGRSASGTGKTAQLYSRRLQHHCPSVEWCVCVG